MFPSNFQVTELLIEKFYNFLNILISERTVKQWYLVNIITIDSIVFDNDANLGLIKNANLLVLMSRWFFDDAFQEFRCYL